MNADELNTFVYQLHFKIESMGVWATNFHETMTDHAAHIDDIRQRTAASFGLVKAETDSIRAAAATAELDTRTVLQKVQENDDQLKASVTKVTDMIGKEIASLKQDGQKITSDTAVEAARVAAKLLELQTAVGDLRTAISSAGPTGTTVVQQLPGPMLSQEIEEIKRKLLDHEQIPAHLLDPEVLTTRLTRVEESVREILARPQGTNTAASSRTVGAQDPWQPVIGQPQDSAQNLSQRFQEATTLCYSLMSVSL